MRLLLQRSRTLLRRLLATAHVAPTAVAVVLLAGLVSLALGAGGTPDRSAPLSAAIAAPALPLPPPSQDAKARQRAAREARAIERVMGYTSYISRGSPHRREIALTFDDGPGPDTLRVMRVLRRTGTPATFFFVGQQVDLFGPTLRAELVGGFAIANHTQNHPPLARLPAKEQRRQLQLAADRGRRYGVTGTRLFRPPYGSYDRATLQVARRLGLLMVLWTIDTEDFRQPGMKAIVRSAVDRARPGAIILMHDAGGPRRQTVSALPLIIHKLRRRHYRLVTVPQLIADDPPSRHQRPPPGIGQG